MEYRHIPVMLKEIENYLAPQPGGYLIDGTLGGGGYTRVLAERVGPAGRILAIDLDPLALQNAAELIKNEKLENIILVQSNFRNLTEIVHEKFPSGRLFDGIVADLGLSSAQLADAARGFSFKEDTPLNMAFGPGSANSTAQIVNRYRAAELERIIHDYGEERFAGRIASVIVTARKIKPITTAKQLADIISQSVPGKFRRGKIHPATRTFQALRLETNEELESLKEFLPQAVTLLKPGGRLAVVSFHSLEDRIVKVFLKNCSEIKIINKKVIIPGPEEAAANPRSRSAKLRVAEKI